MVERLAEMAGLPRRHEEDRDVGAPSETVLCGVQTAPEIFVFHSRQDFAFTLRDHLVN